MAIFCNFRKNPLDKTGYCGDNIFDSANGFTLRLNLGCPEQGGSFALIAQANVGALLKLPASKGHETRVLLIRDGSAVSYAICKEASGAGLGEAG